jgi:hypothetical protein
MITRHHISLAFGSMLILYFPLVSVSPFVLAATAAGVCTGVVLPDIQMKKPREFKALSMAWLLIQIFKKTVLRFYLILYRRILNMQPEAEDKRLTHSLPGLFFLTGLIGIGIFLLVMAGPSYPSLHPLRLFLAGIIIGLLFHFIGDICTKKGLFPFYPFNETYRIAGSIRPCNRDDSRILLFHVQIISVITGIMLLYCTGLCPETLKWPVSVAALVICTVLMMYHAEVRITCMADSVHPLQ